MDELSQRAWACDGWRPMPGASDGEHRVVSVDEDGTFHLASIDDGGRDWCSARGRLVPDMSDPATLGCIEGLLTELYGDGFAVVPRVGHGGEVMWSPVRFRGGAVLPIFGVLFKSKREALVTALEAATSRLSDAYNGPSPGEASAIKRVRDKFAKIDKPYARELVIKLDAELTLLHGIDPTEGDSDS